MRTFPLGIAACVLACTGAPKAVPRGEVVLSVQGLVEHSPLLFGKNDLSSLPKRSFRAADPRSGKDANFEGLALAPLLADRVDLKRDADTAVVLCKDRYAVPVPLAAIRQLRPILASRADGAPLEEWGHAAGAEPFYLAWPNLDSPGLDTDPRARGWWASGVVAIEIVDWDRTYGRALRVPPGASDDARLGAEAFAVHCMECHKLRGQGGGQGPELGTAAHDGADRTAAAVRDHAARGAALPGFGVPPEQAVPQIASFLRTVEAGTTPAEEPPKPERPETPPRQPMPGFPPPPPR